MLACERERSRVQILPPLTSSGQPVAIKFVWCRRTQTSCLGEKLSFAASTILTVLCIARDGMALRIEQQFVVQKALRSIPALSKRFCSPIRNKVVVGTRHDKTCLIYRFPFVEHEEEIF